MIFWCAISSGSAECRTAIVVRYQRAVTANNSFAENRIAGGNEVVIRGKRGLP